jgi:hypothetical protein
MNPFPELENKEYILDVRGDLGEGSTVSIIDQSGRIYRDEAPGAASFSAVTEACDGEGPCYVLFSDITPRTASVVIEYGSAFHGCTYDYSGTFQKSE